MTRTQRWLLLALLAAALTALLWLTWPHLQGSIAPFLDADSWRGWRERIRAFGPLAPLVSIAISIAQLIPIPIPPPTIPLANGWLFGVVGGTLVTWVGVVLNSLLGFWLARGPGRRLFLRLVPRAQIERAEAALRAHGAWAVLVARLMPVLPFSAISVAAGLLHMRWRDYLWATALGVLPSAFALALIGYQLSRGALDWAQVGLAVAILAGFALASIPVSRWLKS